MWMDKASPALMDQAVVRKTALLQNTSINKHWNGFLSSWLSAGFSVSLDCSSTSRLFEPDSWAFFVFGGFVCTFLPLCEIPTDWFQRKASVAFSAELLKSKVTAILCLWNSFSLVYLWLLWVRIWDLPYPSCLWGFHFFCCKISWNKINLKQTQPDCRWICTTELGAAVSCNAWWLPVSFLIMEVLNWKDAEMLAGLDRERY